MSARSNKLKYIIILLVPLSLSAFTHLINPLGFPSIHIDESHYMRRAMLVVQGMGPQESAASGYPRTYDHPYFGQIFLGTVLSVIGYPNVLNPGTVLQSIEMLHIVPRILMGLLAVLDTFLLFKITERRYYSCRSTNFISPFCSNAFHLGFSESISGHYFGSIFVVFNFICRLYEKTP